jgi:hypothetical protein
MADTSLMYYSPLLGKQQPRTLVFQFNVTGAATFSEVNPPFAVLSVNSAIASQSVIDSYLGTTNEFLVAAFDATAMGVDSFAVIANLGGQAYKLLAARARTASGTGGGTVVSREVPASASLTASSLSSEAALGASGNVAARFVLTGLDALTSGLIVVELDVVAK